MRNNKIFIIVACLIVVLLLLCGCGDQNDENSIDTSVNNEVSETVSETSTGEVSEEESIPEESIPVDHTHEYADAWSSNETDHWHECECGDKADIANHAFGDWTTTKEATEDATGSKKRTCSTCGYEETATIPMLSHTHDYTKEWSSNETDHWHECKCGDKSDVANHTYGEWTTTKEATEETEGSKYHTCTACQYKETVVIPALEHTHKYSDKWSNNETDHWKECKCGDKSNVANHNYGNWTVTKEATEETEGSKYHTCNTCGYKETVTIPVLEHTHKYSDKWSNNETDHWKECKCGEKSGMAKHNYGNWTVTKEATEETAGSKYHTCNTCGYKETVTIPVLSHTHSFGSWKNNDTSHWKECRCGDKSEFSSHTYGAWTTTKEATCTATGTKKHTCTACGYSETATIPVIAHTYGNWKSNDTSHWKECKCGDKSQLSSHTYGAWTTTKEATCTATGTKKHTCTACGYSETATIPVIAHTYGDWKSNATSHWKECKCGDKSQLSSHTYGAWTTTKEATCTATGTKKHTCTACGYSETATISVIAHTYGDWKNNDTSHWKECKCGDKSQLSTHAYGAWETTKEATCTTAGTKKHTCTACGYSETATINATGHSYGNWKNDSTNHWKECSKCGDVAEKANHTYGAWETTKEATCTATGTKKHTCTICGHSEIATIPVIAHTYGDWKNDNTNHWKECTKCGDIADKATHTYDSVVTPPTETEKGYTTHTCSTCGYSYVDSYTDPVASYSEGLEYTLSDDGTYYIVTGIGICKDKDIVIPDTYQDKPVKEIGEKAFNNCTSLTSITIPDDVTSIGSYAFNGCSSLKYNEDDNAYYLGNESNPYVVLVKAKSTSVTFCNIHEDTKVIYCEAFKDCSKLTNITVPDSVTSIGSSVFSGCSSLESISLPFVGGYVKTSSDTAQCLFGYIFGTSSYTGGVATKQYYAKDTGTSTTSAITFYIPSTLKSVTITGGNILYGAFSYCDNLASVVIGNGVTSIGNYAFSGCTSLTNITIPDSVTSIGNSTFSNCTMLQYNKYDNAYYLGNENNKYIILVKAIGENISSCSINTSTRFIYSSAFYNCDSLTSIVIPDSVTGIGSYAFYGCSSLSKVTIGNGVTSIGSYAFEYCSRLKSIKIGNSVKIIGNYAFAACKNLTSVTIPNSVTRIYGGAFEGCSGLASVHISNVSAWCNISFGTVYSNPLYYAKKLYLNGTLVKEVVISEGVTSIGFYAFYNCDSLTSIVIPDSVTSIGSYAFNGCSSLSKVTIGNGVTSIGSYAFNGCYSLKSVHISDISAWCSISFGTNTSTPLYYAKKLYLNGTLVTEAVISDGVTSIGSYAFAYYDSLRRIVIPDSVTSVGDYAFGYCTSLSSISFNGTTTQWHRITWGTKWKYDVPATVVKCSDGTVYIGFA